MGERNGPRLPRSITACLVAASLLFLGCDLNRSSEPEPRVELTAETRELPVVVVTDGEGWPIKGATVVWHQRAGSATQTRGAYDPVRSPIEVGVAPRWTSAPLATARTDVDGRVAWPDQLEDDELHLEIHHGDRWAHAVWDDAERDRASARRIGRDSLELHVIPGAHRALDVRVTDPEGRPLSGAEVVIDEGRINEVPRLASSRAPSRRFPSFRVDEDGWASIRLLFSDRRDGTRGIGDVRLGIVGMGASGRLVPKLAKDDAADLHLVGERLCRAEIRIEGLSADEDVPDSAVLVLIDPDVGPIPRKLHRIRPGPEGIARLRRWTVPLDGRGEAVIHLKRGLQLIWEVRAVGREPRRGSWFVPEREDWQPVVAFGPVSEESGDDLRARIEARAARRAALHAPAAANALRGRYRMAPGFKRAFELRLEPKGWGSPRKLHVDRASAMAEGGLLEGGGFEFRELPHGSYDLVVSIDWFELHRFEGLVLEGDEVALPEAIQDLVVGAGYRRERVTVLDPDGRPVHEARVQVGVGEPLDGLAAIEGTQFSGMTDPRGELMLIVREGAPVHLEVRPSILSGAARSAMKPVKLVDPEFPLTVHLPRRER